ncbi:MAG TPA: Re/Si-specific NAD(P)(+) transhydrogenase subunit alpha [Armatimonadetes bacterium]|nr:Re/Si-specific NAD(P)(+) transhydrogenase subunit alpha [Armatimonadota bacterium]
MQIFVPQETHAGERRVALVPDDTRKLTARGAQITVEAGMGLSARHADAAYEAAGATITADRRAMLGAADVILRLRKPPADEVELLKQGAIHISYLDPFNEGALVDAMAAAGTTAISMEMIPRTTRAQKMDALSSQASLAGYVAVLLAAERLDSIFPMMMTPAGTLAPARVFIIGAGVAGLQAIATAKRLGARVEAFDTRPVVAEQVESLGAKFVKVDLGETGQTEGGYAKELTPEQQRLQQEAMAKVCIQSDVVITTAQLFGRPAPRIIGRDVVEQMKPGSVLIDLAVESGGNIEGSQLDEEVDINGVRIVGLGNLPGRVPVHASQMYSANLRALIEEYHDTETGSFKLDLDDEILKGCVVTHGGAVVNDLLLQIRSRNG